MKYKTGDIVYFYHTSDREYGWYISDFTKCEVSSHAFDKKGVMFYSLKYNKGESENEYIKLKLNKINKINYGN